MDYRMNVKQYLKDKLSGRNNSLKNQFMKELGFSIDNVKGYLNMSNTICPPFTKFPEIADFFGDTIYDLFGIKNPNDLSTEEMELIKEYRKASPELQKVVKNIFK
ncbi:MAG: hypothetical protein HFG91_07910 [Acholeplasmatales bacterium]|jgi:hypothetical protein|nr:hypothetical protein [Acholeplasmatales bacterium]